MDQGCLKINQLNLQSNNFVIESRVMMKSEVHLCCSGIPMIRLILADGSGSINAVAYDRIASILFDILEIGVVYTFFFCKKRNENVMPVQSITASCTPIFIDMQLWFNNDTVVGYCTPAKTYGIPNTIPFINYKYKLSQITSLESGTVADFLGTIFKISDLKKFNDHPRQYDYKIVTITDDSMELNNHALLFVAGNALVKLSQHGKIGSLIRVTGGLMKSVNENKIIEIYGMGFLEIFTERLIFV